MRVVGEGKGTWALLGVRTTTCRVVGVVTTRVVGVARPRSGKGAGRRLGTESISLYWEAGRGGEEVWPIRR